MLGCKLIIKGNMHFLHSCVKIIFNLDSLYIVLKSAELEAKKSYGRQLYRSINPYPYS